MKTHEAEAILKYCADIPRRLTIIRRQCATLDDEVDTLKGINMDGMPGGGLPGDSTAAMACKMDELGIGDRLRSLERQQALLKSDEALIRGQIDRLDSVHNLILTEYYIGHKKWAEVQVDAGYSIQHLKRLRNVALLAFGRGMERLPECPALLYHARITCARPCPGLTHRLKVIFSYREDRPSEPHANALPRIESTRRRKTNTTTRKCGKVGKKLPGGLCGLPGIVESEILEGKSYEHTLHGNTAGSNLSLIHI